MTVTTTDRATAFFDELARRGHDPLVRRASGTIRVEVADGDRTARWLVTLDNGDIQVSRGGKAACDCVIRADSDTFDELLAGRANAMAAAIRGTITLGGDWGLLLLFQRLLPGPHDAPETEGGSHS